MTSYEKEDIAKVASLPFPWNKLEHKTIMISGGTGFIGRFITDVLLYRNEKHGDDVKVISLSRRGGKSNNKAVAYLKVDITNRICYDGEVDYILHLASNTHPKQYAEDPIGTITTNVIGCNNLLAFANEKKVLRFLLASSVEIYGQGTEEPMDESYCGYIDCNTARSGYNEAKRTCEALCQSYRQQRGVDCVIVRLARVFGADTKHDTKAMSQFIEKAVLGEEIVLHSKGNQRYSYCYVADAASGILKVLLDGDDGEAYNVSGADEGLSLGDYAGYIAKCAGKQVSFDIIDDANASKATFALLDCSKLEKRGWKPLYQVREALNRTYQIYIARQQIE